MKKQQNKIDLYLCYITLFFYIVLGNILTFNIGNRMPFRVADILALILIIIVPIKYKKIRFTKINKKILIFIIIGILSLFINTIIQSYDLKGILYALLYPARLVFYLLLCNSMIIVFKENKVKFDKISNFIIICFVIVGILGIVQLLLFPNALDFYNILYKYKLYYPNPDPHIDRMFSTYLDPNYFGACMLLPLSFSLTKFIKKRDEFSFIATILFVICIIYTNSRSAFLGLLLLSILVCAINFKFSKKHIAQDLRILFYLLLIGGYILYALFISTKPNVLSRIRNTVEDTIEVQKNDNKPDNEKEKDHDEEPIIDRSTSARFKSWDYSLNVFENNCVIGIGYNAIGMLKHDASQSTAYGVDSSILLILITTGFIGSLYLIINVLKLLVKLFFEKTEDALTLISFIVASLIICNFNNLLFYVLWFIPSILIINAYSELKDKKTVAIDARMINNSGIGVYIQNLLKNNCYDVALGDAKEIKKYNKKIKVIDYRADIYGVKEQLKFPYLKVLKERVDVLHVPHYNVPVFYSGDIVVTIHDLTHLVFPEFLKNKFALIYAKIMLKMASVKATKIITISENTKKDIIHYLHTNKNKIHVVYNGVGDEFVKKSKKEINYLYKKFNIPKNKKILMYVGNLKPHKNLNKLLEALAKIDKKDDYCLLLVGKSFKQQVDLEKIEKDLKLSNVIHTGMVSQDELVDLYNLTDLFVFPSLYEGFGLPPLEALSCGTNVIASNVSSIPEVCMDAVDYFDPYSANSIKKCIENNINKKFDKRLTEKVLSNYSWSEGAQKIKVIINS